MLNKVQQSPLVQKKKVRNFLFVKEWADLLRDDELDLLRLIGNTASASYFWGL